MISSSQTNRALGYLLGERVAVLLVGEKEGSVARLEAFDYPWIRLRHDDGRVACYPYQQIQWMALPDDAEGLPFFSSGPEHAASGFPVTERRRNSGHQ